MTFDRAHLITAPFIVNRHQDEEILLDLDELMVLVLNMSVKVELCCPAPFITRAVQLMTCCIHTSRQSYDIQTQDCSYPPANVYQ